VGSAPNVVAGKSTPSGSPYRSVTFHTPPPSGSRSARKSRRTVPGYGSNPLATIQLPTSFRTNASSSSQNATNSTSTRGAFGSTDRLREIGFS
jgi:hypothetical protein